MVCHYWTGTWPWPLYMYCTSAHCNILFVYKKKDVLAFWAPTLACVVYTCTCLYYNQFCKITKTLCFYICKYFRAIEFSHFFAKTLFRNFSEYKLYVDHMYCTCLFFPIQCLCTLQGHTGGVWCSEFNGSVIVSGSTDRTLRVSHDLEPHPLPRPLIS